MTSDDFLNSFSNHDIQDLILMNNDFAEMVVQKIRDDGYDVNLMNFGKPKLLEINWDVVKEKQPKEVLVTCLHKLYILIRRSGFPLLLCVHFELSKPLQKR